MAECGPARLRRAQRSYAGLRGGRHPRRRRGWSSSCSRRWYDQERRALSQTTSPTSAASASARRRRPCWPPALSSWVRRAGSATEQLNALPATRSARFGESGTRRFRSCLSATPTPRLRAGTMTSPRADGTRDNALRVTSAPSSLRPLVRAYTERTQDDLAGASSRSATATGDGPSAGFTSHRRPNPPPTTKPSPTPLHPRDHARHRTS